MNRTLSLRSCDLLLTSVLGCDQFLFFPNLFVTVGAGKKNVYLLNPLCWDACLIEAQI
jgi:hypothetical protein